MKGPVSAKPRSMMFIPAYQAATTIEHTLSRIPEDVWELVDEVFVQDNHSDDDTRERVLAYRDEHRLEKLKVYRMDRNLGYGGSEKRAITYAIERGVDFIVVLHADGQYQPERIQDLLAPLYMGECEMVQGSRTDHRSGGMPWYKVVSNWALNQLERSVFGYDLREYHSGFRAYSCEALATIPYLECSDGHGITAELVAMFSRFRLRIHEIEVPTHYGPEVSVASLGTSVRYGLYVIRLAGEFLLARSGLYSHPRFRLIAESRPADEEEVSTGSD